MRALKWMFVNVMFSATLVAGLDFGVDGARNVGLFAVWVSSLASLAANSEGAIEGLAKQEWPAVPGVIRTLFCSAIVCYLVWHGEILAGAAYLVRGVLMSLALAEATALRAKAGQA
ncbi:MAG: hypothetical protein U1E96_08875 [Azonexus sp.]